MAAPDWTDVERRQLEQTEKDVESLISALATVLKHRLPESSAQLVALHKLSQAQAFARQAIEDAQAQREGC